MTEKLFTKNFTLLILGQLTSLFGNFILKLALSMYVLEATGSAAIFAGILSAATIPTILLSPLGGQGRQTEYYGVFILSDCPYVGQCTVCHVWTETSNVCERCLFFYYCPV